MESNVGCKDELAQGNGTAASLESFRATGTTSELRSESNSIMNSPIDASFACSNATSSACPSLPQAHIIEPEEASNTSSHESAKAIPTDFSTPTAIVSAPFSQNLTNPSHPSLNPSSVAISADFAKDFPGSYGNLNNLPTWQAPPPPSNTHHASPGILLDPVALGSGDAAHFNGISMAAEPTSGAPQSQSIYLETENKDMFHNLGTTSSALYEDPCYGLDEFHNPEGSHSTGSRNTERDEGVQTGRVDASQLEVLENPLSKSDRYTVIKGRLPDSDPYMQAAKKLGLVFMSTEMQNCMQNVSEGEVTAEERKVYFMKDIEAFNKELNRDYKIPIIGGGQLSLYALAMEVLKLGGLKNVVINRAFRIVGQQLELPKSCTSAAFVLKNAYERLLYLYEQKLAFGTTPKHPQRTIDMKSVVSETKKKIENAKSRGKKPKSVVGIDPGILQGRVCKKSNGEDIDPRRADALRDAAAQDGQFASGDESLIPQLTVGQDCFSSQVLPVETLTPQQPESIMGGFMPDSDILAHDWTEQTGRQPVYSGFLSTTSHAQDRLDTPCLISPVPVSTIILDATAGPEHVDVPLKERKIKTEEEATFAIYGSDDSVRALQMAAKILQTLRDASTPMRLSKLKAGAGATLVSAIVQGLSNYREALQSSSDTGWRAVIARCGGEMLRLLLIEQDNQVFCAMSKNLWLVARKILESGKEDDPVVSSLWGALSIMAPYLVSNVRIEFLADLLQIASNYLCRSSHGAVEVSWFVSGSVRGLTSKMSPEHDFLITQLFESLARLNVAEDGALRHSTLTALLHLSRVYPERAGCTAGLLYRLIEQLTEPSLGGLSASTLYYITQANPQTLHGYEDYLVSQTRRVASLNTGPQADQVVAILGLLTNGA